jgi:hypothetical protein
MKTQTQLPLKDQIRIAFPDMKDSDFDRHETDLYVKWSPDVEKWLRANYEHWSNITRFRSQIDSSTWFDIPFAAWSEKYPNSKFN